MFPAIEQFGLSSRTDLLEQLTSISRNGVYLAFRDNVVYNAFIPTNKNYFKGNTIMRFREWAERLRRWFTVFRSSQ